MELPEFRGFAKIARLSREIFISEKIDGTNSSIYISDDLKTIIAGSRNRWITPQSDNHGFAKWVEANKEELLELGAGHHFGEWWGSGIGRGYGLKEKRFSLFNVGRWDIGNIPKCCHIVPLLNIGIFSTELIEQSLNILKEFGSLAEPGYLNPEGIVIYHTASNSYFKKTLKNDELPKSSLK